MIFGGKRPVPFMPTLDVFTVRASQKLLEKIPLCAWAEVFICDSRTCDPEHAATMSCGNDIYINRSR